MSLLFMDGFDHYSSGAMGKWGSIGGIFDASAGRRGGGCIRDACGGSKSITTASLTGILGFAFKASNPDHDFITIKALPGSVPDVLFLRFAGNAGTVAVWRSGFGGGAQLCISPPSSFNGFIYNYFEFKWYVHATLGTVEVRCNGQAICSAINQNTQGFGNTIWNTLAFYAYGGAFDDLYLCDGAGSLNNDFLGDCRVDTHYPTGDGATHTFTPSTGTDHWEMVNETTPNSDTDYNAGGSPGVKDTLVVEDFKNPGGVIHGVQVLVCAKKTDAGNASLCPVLRHNGADNDGSAVALSTQYTYLRQVYDQNPNGGSPIDWNEADFNAAEFGYKKTV